MIVLFRKKCVRYVCVLAIGFSLIVLVALFFKKYSIQVLEKEGYMPIGKLETLLFNFKMAPKYHCSNVKRMGRTTDGGWDICLDEGVKPSEKCLVYSFGIAKDWSFDEAMAEKYNCEVHSFDPSIDHPNSKHGENIWYYNIGLSDEDNDRMQVKPGIFWPMKTLPSIIKQLNHEGRVIDMLKMDIEHSEWKAIPNMLKSNVFANVKQFAFEMHTYQIRKKEPEGVIYKMINLLKSLEEHGLYLYKADSNPVCKYVSYFTGRTYAGCKNLYYVNSKYLQ